MSGFPLYENLISLKRNKRYLSKEEKRQLVENIKLLNQDGHNKIIALILYHQIIHSLNYISPVPSEVMEINLGSLPVPLQEVIEIFVIKHLKFMEDEKQRANIAL